MVWVRLPLSSMMSSMGPRRQLQPLVEVVGVGHVLPGVHDLLQVLLGAELLVGLHGDVEGERVRLGVDAGRLPRELPKLPPMPVAHGRGAQIPYEGEGRSHVLHL